MQASKSSKIKEWIYLGNLFLAVNASNQELQQLQQLDSITSFSSSTSVVKEQTVQSQCGSQFYLVVKVASKHIDLKLLVQDEENRELRNQRMIEKGQFDQFNTKLIGRQLQQNLVAKGLNQIFTLDCPNLIRLDKIPETKPTQSIHFVSHPIDTTQPYYLGTLALPSNISSMLPQASNFNAETINNSPLKFPSKPNATSHLMTNQSLQNPKHNSQKIKQQKLAYQCLVSVSAYILQQRIKQWDQNFDLDPQYSTESKFMRRIDLLIKHLKSNQSNWNQKYMGEQVRKKYFPKCKEGSGLGQNFGAYEQVNLDMGDDQKNEYQQNGVDQEQKTKKKLKIFDLATYNIKQTQQPDRFDGKLIAYQKQALTWMLYRQGAIKNISMDMTHSINWQNLRQVLNVDHDLYFNPEYSVVLTKKPLKQCRGGIIADQMGLGKTIMMISLMLAHRPTGDSIGKATLVISPLSVLSEWENHLKQFAPSLKIFQYYESNRKLQQLKRVDIVLISEGVLRSQYAKSKDLNKKDFTIFDIQWFRVIVDEAHNFKNSRSQGSNAMWELFTQYRWCLTGTPAQNSYGDLYSLIKFLHYKPWDNLQKWNSYLPKYTDRKMEKGPFLAKKIQEILKGIMIRRTKTTKNQSGERLLQLPQLLNLELEVELEENIRKDYGFLVQLTLKKLGQLQKAQKDYQTQVTTDKVKRFKQRKQIEKLVNFIMAKIMILRQLCCHSFLFNYSKELVRYDQFVEKYDKFLAKKNIRSFKRAYQSYDKIKDIANKSKFQCQMCKQIPSSGVISPCLHVYCKQCATSYAKQQLLRSEQDNKSGSQTFIFEQSIMKTAKKKLKKRLAEVQLECFACKNKIKYQNFFPMPRLNHFDRPLQQFQYNQKFSMLVHGLRQLKQGEKAIIYTNFLGVVMLLQQTMRRQRIVHQVIKGDDKQKSRVAKLSDFQTIAQLRVLIITLKPGCVGLNLQIANKIFIMDPWWNPFIEDQAIARSHRIGQKKDVQVVTFVTKNTIQERVKQLKILKKEIIADLMMDQLEEGNDSDEEFGEIKRGQKTKKGTKLKKTQQFRILLQQNQKYHSVIEQMQQQKNGGDIEKENQLNQNNEQIKKQ